MILHLHRAPVDFDVRHGRLADRVKELAHHFRPVIMQTQVTDYAPAQLGHAIHQVPVGSGAHTKAKDA